MSKVTPKDWQHVKELFEAALKREPVERVAFLDQACAGDEALRREVESLLKSYEQAGSFMDAPAVESAAESLLEEQVKLSPGQRMGHYQIVNLIGEGGMGEVYLAEDVLLGRKVALKLLPAEFTKDLPRVRRFQQEARAASALNHPNIITIYEIGEHDSSYFIATEFIDGLTLRAKLQRGPLKLGQALDVAHQVALALTAAHEAKIVHRDIKPENIMLRRDGIAKVLDFGLAKLTERVPPASVDTEAPTRAVVNTDAGVVMGTATYMSPEQARGLEVDARTDIFSLGDVIYETVAGHPPFEGSNTNEILASILSDKEPWPLARYVREVPAELERIVAKALRKNRDERYQTIKDLLLDLKTLKQELEFSARLERSAAASEFAVPPSGGQIGQATTSPLEGGTQNLARATTSVVQLTGQIAKHRGLAILAAVVVVVVAATIVYFGGAYFKTKKSINSLAVLPLANASNDPNTEYLSDGITESIINSLSQLPTLKVMARTTVFHYKGKETDAQKVGKELGVEAVLTGKLLQRGDTLVIQADLVKVSDGSQLWGEQYNRKVADILQVQDEIAKEITGKLRLRLTGEDQQRLAKHPTQNPEAYRLYLQGRYYANRLTQEGFEKGIASLNQAIALDPNYALAYVGLGGCYFQAIDLILPPMEAIPKAREAVKRALALDETLAGAHAMLGAIHWQYDWDWAAAEREFRRAIELNPNEARVHASYGFFLALMGRFDEGIAEEKRAQELDPLSVSASLQLGVALYLARRYDQAVEQARQTINMDPKFWLAHTVLGRAYEQKGQLVEAIAECQKAREIDDTTTEILMDLGRAYAVAGKRAEAEQVLAELQKRSKSGYVAPFHIANVYVGLGEKDQAFAWLEKAYEARSWYMTWLKVDPALDSLRSDPRFADLVRRAGL
jgi:serine/threonine-protein kinase